MDPAPPPPCSPSPAPPEPADAQEPESQDANHRRTGKVARLPKAIRDQINTLILDGVSYPTIRETLGLKDISDSNISNWVTRGGYHEWLHEQRHLMETRVRQEVAIDVACKEEGSRIHEGTLQLAATSASQMLRDFDLAEFKELLGHDPAKLIPFLNALARISDAELRCEQHRLKLQERKAALDQSNPSAKPPGLSPQTRKEIERELKLM